MKLFTVAIAMIAVVSAGCRDDCVDELNKCYSDCKTGDVHCAKACNRDYDKCFNECANPSV